eukprot:6779372-Pyramimonas_sp.AAC.2
MDAVASEISDAAGAVVDTTMDAVAAVEDLQETVDGLKPLTDKEMQEAGDVIKKVEPMVPMVTDAYEHSKAKKEMKRSAAEEEEVKSRKEFLEVKKAKAKSGIDFSKFPPLMRHVLQVRLRRPEEH